MFDFQIIYYFIKLLISVMINEGIHTYIDDN